MFPRLLSTSLKKYFQNWVTGLDLKRLPDKKWVSVCYLDEKMRYVPNPLKHSRFEEEELNHLGWEEEEEILKNIVPKRYLLPVFVSLPVYEKSGFSDQHQIRETVNRYFTRSMSSLFTMHLGEPYIYFFGCVDVYSENLDPLMEHHLKGVYRYHLGREMKGQSILQCESMTSGILANLPVKIDGYIYVLGYPAVWEIIRGQKESDGILRPLFQMYDIKKDTWQCLDDDPSIDIINKSSEDFVLRINKAPHVVIGHKLHISIGNHSFTFDSKKRVWAESKLFETFWQKNKESGLTTSNFYGNRLGVERDSKASKLSKGGPPLGFYGKGLLWNEKILLGVHFRAECHLVAFLLDDENGEKIVVQSQPIKLKNVTLPTSSMSHSSLLDLGNDTFCLVHTVSDDKPVVDNKDMDEEDDGEEFFPVNMFGGPRYLELVTFKVSIIENDAKHFLECEVMSTYRVPRKLPDFMCNFLEAFTVDK